MSSTRGHFVFFLVAPKTGTRSVTFFNNPFCCHPLLPPGSGSEIAEKKNKHRRGCCLWVTMMHLSSTPGQFSPFFKLLQAARKLRCLLLKKAKIRNCYRTKIFPGRLRRCKIFKHAQLSLIGSYSPFPRRRWGAFSISFFSPKREQPAFIKNKPITAHNSPLLFSGTH